MLHAMFRRGRKFSTDQCKAKWVGCFTINPPLKSIDFPRVVANVGMQGPK